MGCELSTAAVAPAGTHLTPVSRPVRQASEAVLAQDWPAAQHALSQVDARALAWNDRWAVWSLLAVAFTSPPAGLTASDILVQTYDAAVQLVQDALAGKSSPETAAVIQAAAAQIDLDIARTLPGLPAFQEDAPAAAPLCRVLLVAAAAREDVGFCQGMAPLAFLPLLAGLAEPAALGWLNAVLTLGGANSMFKPGMPGVPLIATAMRHGLGEMLDVAAGAAGVPPDVIVHGSGVRWALSGLLYSPLPLSTVLVCWDWITLRLLAELAHARGAPAARTYPHPALLMPVVALCYGARAGIARPFRAPRKWAQAQRKVASMCLPEVMAWLNAEVDEHEAAAPAASKPPGFCSSAPDAATASAEAAKRPAQRHTCASAARDANLAGYRWLPLMAQPTGVYAKWWPQATLPALTPALGSTPHAQDPCQCDATRAAYTGPAEFLALLCKLWAKRQGAELGTAIQRLAASPMM